MPGNFYRQPAHPWPAKYLNVLFVVRQAEPSLIVPATAPVIRGEDVRFVAVTPDPSGCVQECQIRACLWNDYRNSCWL